MARDLGRLSRGGLVVALASAAGCLPSYTFDDGRTDAHTEAASTAHDAQASKDGGVDARRDAKPSGDSSVDARHEGGVDAGHDATVDAAHDGGSKDAGDASPTHDAGVLPDAASYTTTAAFPFTAAVTFASGMSAYPIGYAEQTHLIYATGDMAYWLFYFDQAAPTAIQVARSPDLVNWSSSSLDLGVAGYGLADGYSFSVAYAYLGSTDVVHVIANLAESGMDVYQTVHRRAVISHGAISFGSSAVVQLARATNGSACPNDGPVTAIGPDGSVYDVTAWRDRDSGTVCDTNIYKSQTPDLGGAGSNAAFTIHGYYVSVHDYSYSHALVGLPAEAGLMLVYPDQDPESNPYFYHSIGWALSTTFFSTEQNGLYLDGSAPELFTSPLFSSFNGWSVCNAGSSGIHILRHAGPSMDTSAPVTVLQDMVYVGGAWTSHQQPPTTQSPLNLGVATVTSGSTMKVATVSEATGGLQVLTSTAPGVWSSANTYPEVPASTVAGSGCGGPAPVLLWTDSTADTINVVDATSL